MKTTLKLTFVLSILLMVFVSQSSAEWLVATKGKVVNNPERQEQFMDWGLGMFIHWSLDSQLGSVISHSMVGATDKYLDRFINELPKTFNPKRYDADEWMEIAKLAGVKYMVLTTKHHSGFCMWDTATTEFNIMSTPYQKDIVKEYVAACRRHGLKVGFYFSPEDFYFLHRQGHVIRRRADYANISNNKELLEYNKRQMKELMTKYGKIDVAFLDAFDNAAIRDYIHELQPECLITRGEMATPEQKIPDAPIPGPWESCFTLGTQWQFKPTNEDYKSGGKLIEMLIETRAKGGNLLINVGPEPSGIIPFEQERTFRELALWMFVNDEAIHNIRPCKVIGEEKMWYTQSNDGKAVYVFMTEFVGQNRWKHGERKDIVLKSWKATDQTQVSVLGQNDKALEYQPDVDPASSFKQTEAGLELSIMRAQRIYNNKTWPNTVVLKLENVEFVERTN